MGTVKSLLSIAAGELGVRESPAGSNRVKYNTWYYGREVSGDSYPWCMAFVQWVFHQAGVPLPRQTASCLQLMQTAAAARQWVTGGYRPGDVVIYDFPGGTTTDHCGIVESVQTTGVTAIEGNTGSGADADGGQVQRRFRPLLQIVGAVRPIYEKEEPEMDKEQFKDLWMELRGDLQARTGGTWSAEARQWAMDNGLIQGTPDMRGQISYMWGDVLSREQLVVVLYRFAKMAGLV